MTTTRKVISKSEVLRMLKEKEEKVIRMKRGVAADLEMELELKANNNPEIQAKIAEIEKGIFDDIKALIEEYERPGTNNMAKSKIITTLKRKK